MRRLVGVDRGITTGRGRLETGPYAGGARGHERKPGEASRPEEAGWNDRARPLCCDIQDLCRCCVPVVVFLHSGMQRPEAEETEASGLVRIGDHVKAPAEIIFEVTEAVNGGFDARALGYSIFTQGDDWADLKAMVKDAVACHFGDAGELKVVRLHFV